ncbi:unnamed protein product [Caenorhabditis sp. 36 PRJEB53466]|nr:unnamed protein product [Caenorhabditis sp. 36 PRJEB53466]
MRVIWLLIVLFSACAVANNNNTDKNVSTFRDTLRVDNDDLLMSIQSVADLPLRAFLRHLFRLYKANGFSKSNAINGLILSQKTISPEVYTAFVRILELTRTEIRQGDGSLAVIEAAIWLNDLGDETAGNVLEVARGIVNLTSDKRLDEQRVFARKLDGLWTDLRSLEVHKRVKRQDEESGSISLVPELKNLVKLVGNVIRSIPRTDIVDLLDKIQNVLIRNANALYKRLQHTTSAKKRDDSVKIQAVVTEYEIENILEAAKTESSRILSQELLNEIQKLFEAVLEVVSHNQQVVVPVDTLLEPIRHLQPQLEQVLQALNGSDAQLRRILIRRTNELYTDLGALLEQNLVDKVNLTLKFAELHVVMDVKSVVGSMPEPESREKIRKLFGQVFKPDGPYKATAQLLPPIEHLEAFLDEALESVNRSAPDVFKTQQELVRQVMILKANEFYERIQRDYADLMKLLMIYEFDIVINVQEVMGGVSVVPESRRAIRLLLVNVLSVFEEAEPLELLQPIRHLEPELGNVLEALNESHPGLVGPRFDEIRKVLVNQTNQLYEQLLKQNAEDHITTTLKFAELFVVKDVERITGLVLDPETRKAIKAFFRLLVPVGWGPVNLNRTEFIHSLLEDVRATIERDPNDTDHVARLVKHAAHALRTIFEQTSGHEPILELDNSIEKVVIETGLELEELRSDARYSEVFDGDRVREEHVLDLVDQAVRAMVEDVVEEWEDPIYILEAQLEGFIKKWLIEHLPEYFEGFVSTLHFAPILARAQTDLQDAPTLEPQLLLALPRVPTQPEDRAQLDRMLRELRTRLADQLGLYEPDGLLEQLPFLDQLAHIPLSTEETRQLLQSLEGTVKSASGSEALADSMKVLARNASKPNRQMLRAIGAVAAQRKIRKTDFLHLLQTISEQRDPLETRLVLRAGARLLANFGTNLDEVLDRLAAASSASGPSLPRKLELVEAIRRTALGDGGNHFAPTALLLKMLETPPIEFYAQLDDVFGDSEALGEAEKVLAELGNLKPEPEFFALFDTLPATGNFSEVLDSFQILADASRIRYFATFLHSQSPRNVLRTLRTIGADPRLIATWNQLSQPLDVLVELLRTVGSYENLVRLLEVHADVSLDEESPDRSAQNILDLIAFLDAHPDGFDAPEAPVTPQTPQLYRNSTEGPPEVSEAPSELHQYATEEALKRTEAFNVASEVPEEEEEFPMDPWDPSRKKRSIRLGGRRGSD